MEIYIIIVIYLYTVFARFVVVSAILIAIQLYTIGIPVHTKQCEKYGKLAELVVSCGARYKVN